MRLPVVQAELAMQRSLIIGLTAAASLPSIANSAVIRVPEDYPSVVAGVDAAAGGDSVLVGPGTWTDRVVRTILVFGSPLTVESAMYLKPGVTVVGTSGAAATILDGGTVGAYPLYTIEHVQPGTQAARVVGFTVTGGGTGIAASGSSPLELEACRVVSNARRGITSRETSLILTNCLIAENELTESTFTGAISGIDVNVTCEGCTFERNTGPGLRISHSSAPLLTVVLRDCTFLDHARRGASLGDVGSLEIERCLFFRNSTAGGTGGGLTLTRCGGVVRFSTFAFDTADGGGGLGVTASYVHVENNTFYRCHARTVGGAMIIDTTDIGTFGNIFSYSTGRRGAVAGMTPGPQTGCNLYWANADGDYFADWIPAPNDIHADPLFCDPVILDLGLQAASPAAPPNSGVCGLIGAYEVTCGAISVEPQSWGRIKNLFR